MIYLLILFGILMIAIPVTAMELFTRNLSEKEKQEVWENFYNQLNK